MGMKKLLSFLNQLEQHKIFYKLNKVRNDAIMVEVAVPGERWEVEFMEDDTVEVEKFMSDGNYYNHKEIDWLFENFTDS